MDEQGLINVPKMSVGDTVKMLSDAYSALINGGIPVSKFPSVMLWGAPGVGKSQGVRQVAQAVARATGRRANVTDVRLLMFNPIDLRGIPTANADRTLAVWLKPRIFDMDESASAVNFLLLDEISAAPQSVQAAAYQITLDRVIGEHRLPDNCIVLAAGNRLTDKSVTFKMPKALANRLMHIEIQPNFDSWCKWAVSHGINPQVVGFLSFRRDFFCRDAASEELAFATPRAWELVSNVLNYSVPDVSAAFPMIAGLVGTGTAVEFRTWSAIYRSLPDVKDIFAGKDVAVPRGTDVLYALTSSMTAFAREHRDDMRLIANAVHYAQRLPADFSAVLLRDFTYLEQGYIHKLMKLPEFTRWLNEKGRLLNGNIGE